MKLYVLRTGFLNLRRGLFSPDSHDAAERFPAPVLCFLIEHPKGLVLFDTGVSFTTAIDPARYWGDKMARAFDPSVGRGEDLLRQLMDLGYQTDDIDYVVLSHLHIDHAGNIRYFSNADFIVQEAELAAAMKQDAGDSGYSRSDWDYPILYHPVQGRKDLFNDGRIVLELFPGHTPGMQIAILNLDKSGKVALVQDAAAIEANVMGTALPRNNADSELYKESIEKLRALNNEGVTLIYGHDESQWRHLNRPPAFYE
jgi:glyoxylase-like metal-dependent hydrolase (beta-lactamase superfamily II)